MTARRLGPAAETLALLALGAAAIHVALLPNGLGAQRPPTPDLVFCLAFAWVVRRPAEAPLWAVLALGLAADVMLARPLGLGALGLLLATEAARANAVPLQAGPLAAEWLAAVCLFAAILLGTQAALRLVFLDGAAWGALLGHAGATALAYPAVVALLALGPGVRSPRRAAAGDRLGRIA